WWLTLLRLALAALVIIAAAGPLWNPPLATSSASAPLALLIDDGWPAAASWDARLRTAEDLIARAETDNPGIALILLSEGTVDISLQAPAAARVRLKQIIPKPHNIERADTLPAIERLVAATPNVEIVWLSDGVDTGKAGDFVQGLAHVAANHSLAVIAGGLPTVHALSAADNTA